MRLRAMLFGEGERRVNQKCEIVQALEHFLAFCFSWNSFYLRKT
jgi:hypothetical protein